MDTKKTSGPLLTREEVKRWFEASGETVTAWAAAHGYRRDEVYALLNGRLKGRRGRAHQLAVDLGIKETLGSKPSRVAPTMQQEVVENDPSRSC